MFYFGEIKLLKKKVEGSRNLASSGHADDFKIGLMISYRKLYNKINKSNHVENVL